MYKKKRIQVLFKETMGEMIFAVLMLLIIGYIVIVTIIEDFFSGTRQS